MKKIDRTNLLVGMVAGLIVGLLLGMLLFWGLFPVKWTDAHSYDLAPDARAEYLALVADSYKLDRDLARVSSLLELWTPEEKQQAVTDAIAMYEEEGRTDKVQAVRDLAMVLGISEAPPPPPAPPAKAPGLVDRLRIPCLVFIVVLLVLALAWIGLRTVRKRQAAAVPRPSPTVRVAPPPPPAEEWEGVEQPPLGHFITTYQLGEDTYDESFSIETPMGEFLGECGVGISETIGVGEPDKVTAFEVWLFDKSDIRTVTKVLMSQYAYNDPNLRAKLAPKGEAVLAMPGTPVILETSGLQVRADITELVYGEGDLPANSFFSRLTIELVARAKPPEAGDYT